MVWDDRGLAAGDDAAPVDAARLKAIEETYPVAPLTTLALRFIEWVARYTLSQPGTVLRMALSVRDALKPPRPIALYAATNKPPDPSLRLTPARRRVLQVLQEGPARTLAEVAREAGVSTGVIKGLETAGLVECTLVEPKAQIDSPDWRSPGPSLSSAQRSTAARLCAKLDAGEGGVLLLDGVTGSGKTEVYLEAVAKSLELGHQVLVLLPEIALSAQWLERFTARFGARPSTWHSDMNPAAAPGDLACRFRG